MPPKKQLLADDSEESGDEVNQLTINKDYAERYDNWRKKEEYQKLKDKYGENVLSEGSELSDSDTDDSSDSDQEDLDRKLHSQIFDKNFIEVYKALKKDDPKLYDESYSFAPKPEEKDETNDPTEKKSKNKKNEKMTLLDYHVKLVKERGGKTEEDENQASTSTSYYEQLDSIKDEFKQVLQDSSDEEDLITGVKPTEFDDSSDSSNVKLDEPRDDDEKFLYDFILNKRYLDGVSAPKQKKKKSKGTKDEVDDEEDSTKQKHLEVKQYRFEEPGGTEIQRFPRDIDSARDLSSREEKTEKRKELKERKRKEREEDLKRFTQLKRDQLTEKLKTLRDTSGNDAFLQSSKDITSLIDDDIFDPDKHDQQMAKLFGDGYYADENDQEKPHFEFIEGLDDDINDDGQDDEEMGNALESDEDEGKEDETEEASSSTKKSARSRRREKKKERKRKEKKLDLDKIPDYDDVIAGELPIRFKYRKVKPNDYGLSTEEILNADDKELNKWVSLKKAVGYRPEDEEERELKFYQNRKNDTRYKMKILKSLFKEDEEDGNDGNEDKQSKKKRKRKRKAKISTTNPNEEEEEHDAIDNEEEEEHDANDNEEMEDSEKREDQDSATEVVQPLSKTKQKKLKHRAIVKKKQEAQLERLQAYGLSKREIKRRKINL